MENKETSRRWKMMAIRRNRSIFEEYKYMIQKGRGQGVGQHYQPWLKVNQIPSKGFSHRLLGWKTNRVHHLLSNLELSYFYILEWNSKVKDVRERYPLDPKRTMEIAHLLKIQHPIHPKTKQFRIMTTDFFITDINDRHTAVSVMPMTNLEKKRTIQLLEIERMYWHQFNVEFAVITDKDIPISFIDNIRWIHKTLRLEDGPLFLSEETIVDIEPHFYRTILQSSKSLSRACSELDQYHDFPIGTSLWIVRHFIANKTWKTNMLVPIDTAKPLKLIAKKEECDVTIRSQFVN
jgi:hypothetical protein